MKRFFYSVILCAFAIVTLTPLATGAGNVVEDTIAAMPANSPQAARALFGRLLAEGGPEAVASLCGKILPAEAATDAQARFALGGLAIHASKSTEAQRLLVSEGLLHALKQATNDEVKDFFLEQLTLVASDEAVDAVAALSGDARLGDRSIGVLQRIATPGAEQALLSALNTPGHTFQPRLIKALGLLKTQKALPHLSALAAASDAPIRDAALVALSQIASPDSQAILREAARTEDPAARATYAALYLDYAENLAAADNTAQAEKIAEELLAASDIQIRCAAMHLLAALRQEEVLPVLIAAMDAPDPHYRGAALLLADQIPGRSASVQWCSKAAQVSPAVRCEIFAMLGGRPDSAARKALLDGLKDSDTTVQAASLSALTRHGGRMAVQSVAKRLEDAMSLEEAKTAAESLLRLPGSGVAKRANEILLNPAISTDARKAAIGILAARRAERFRDTLFAQANHEDAGVRVDALKALGTTTPFDERARLVARITSAKSDEERAAARDAAVVCANDAAIPKSHTRAKASRDNRFGALGEAARTLRVEPFIRVIPQSEPAAHAALLEALVALGGEAALNQVLADSKHADETVAKSAIAALGAWDTEEAIPGLLGLLSGSLTAERRAVVLDAALRQADKSSRSDETRAWLLQMLMKHAQSKAEKVAILASVAKVRHLDPLATALSALSEPATEAAAAEAIVRIVCPPKADAKGLTGPEAEQALKQALPKLSSEPLKAQAEAYLSKVNPEGKALAQATDEAGFESIFNGFDFTGWTGNLEGYRVAAGKIISKLGAGGNIYTQNEYGNFVLRLEFKLTPGANNGLGIRTPLNSHVAYDGIELQVLDNEDPKYATLQPYQYHGSVYGIAPAKRGFLRAPGEWNQQEVVVKGRQIKVVLNGETILDVNLDEAVKNGIADGKEHPGLALSKGHIAFCGHNDVVEFRNLRIKPLQ